MCRFALPLLLACAGCYNPKADIDAHRSQAEKYLADMERVGKAVAALPPLAQDTLQFSNPPDLRFLDGPDGKQNAELLHLEELSDVGSSHNDDRLVSAYCFQDAVALLKTGKGPARGKATKQIVEGRFRRLLEMKYLVVLRTRVHKSATVTGADAFEGGEIGGEAYLCEMVDPPAIYGGITYAARNSQQVSVMVRGKDDPQQQRINRQNAVRSNMEGQARKMIYQKLKDRLLGAKFPSHW